MSEPGDKTANSGQSDDPAVSGAARAALDLVRDGMRLGLGSGRASHVFIRLLANQMAASVWNIKGVPTSRDSESLARDLGIPLTDLSEDVFLDLTVDGADEVAPGNDLIKGWGNALVRERIVAAASRRQIILVGPEKKVAALGERGKIPVEVIPLARGPVMRSLKSFGWASAVRMRNGEALLTDNGNITLDCVPSAPLNAAAARAMERNILDLPGVLDTGMFLGTAERVIVGRPDGSVEIILTPGQPA